MTIHTLEDCKLACIVNLTCVAIDYVVDKSECWIHVSASNIAVLGDADGIDNYRLSRCVIGKAIKFPQLIQPLWDEIVHFVT